MSFIAFGEEPEATKPPEASEMTSVSGVSGDVEEKKPEIDPFVLEAKKYWRKFERSSQKKYVSYSEDFLEKTAIDFEKGQVTVSVLTEQTGAKSKKDILSHYKDAWTRLTKLKAGKLEDFMEDQLDIEEGMYLARVNNLRPERLLEAGSEGTRRNKFKFRFFLKPDHLKTRIKLFESQIEKWVDHFDLDKNLVYAVILNESAFNPFALSKAPAYGLMQIVPKHAGLEMNKLLNKKDEMPTPTELYQPDTNIQFGTSYLNQLQGSYFKKITDADIRRILVICSYNWGPQNVNELIDSGKVTAKGNAEILSKAIVRYLPDETKTYLKKVTTYYQMFKDGKFS